MASWELADRVLDWVVLLIALTTLVIILGLVVAALWNMVKSFIDLFRP